MRVVFRADAEAELVEARAWYEERSTGLGARLEHVVAVALASALRHPFAYPHIVDDYRRIVLRRFPYSIIYLVEDSELVVVSCFHNSRSPDAWRDRLDT